MNSNEELNLNKRKENGNKTDNYLKAKNPNFNKSKNTPNSKLCGVLNQLADDVTKGQCLSPGNVIYYTNGSKNSHQPLYESDNIFIQQKNGTYKLTPKELIANANGENLKNIYFESDDSNFCTTALDVAIVVQKLWKNISTFCFGLLSGIGFLQLLIVHTTLFTKWDSNSLLKFTETYSLFSYIIPASFYVLLTMCIVSLSDRFDLGHVEDKQLNSTSSHRLSYIPLIIYFIALIISLSNISADECFHLYEYNSDFTKNYTTFSWTLQYWMCLDVIRCILVILAWLILSFLPPDDLMSIHLKEMKKYDTDNDLDN